MDKKARNSISNRRSITNTVEGSKRRSLSTLQFFQGRKVRAEDGVPEIDDIDYITRLVDEEIEFDWDKFEQQREMSMFLKGKNQSRNSLLNRKSVTSLSKYEEVMVENSGAVEGVDIDSDDDTVVLRKSKRGTLHNANIMAKIPSGKEKLKFVSNFAKKTNQQPWKGSRKDFGSMEPTNILKMKHSLIQSRLQRSRTLRQAKKSLTKKKISESKSVNSLGSEASGASASEFRDMYARLKGFKSEKHMEKHFQRHRGLEELQEAAEVQEMAAENGYIDVDNASVGAEAYEADTFDEKAFWDEDDREFDEAFRVIDAEERDLSALMGSWERANVEKQERDEKKPHSRSRTRTKKKGSAERHKKFVPRDSLNARRKKNRKSKRNVDDLFGEGTF